MLLNVYAQKIKDVQGHTETRIFKENGEFFCTIPWYSKQPTKRQKTITLNCCKWNLNWLEKPV